MPNIFTGLARGLGAYGGALRSTSIGVGTGLTYGYTRRNEQGNPDWTRAADAGTLAYEASLTANRLVFAGSSAKAVYKQSALWGSKSAELLKMAEGYSTLAKANKWIGAITRPEVGVHAAVAGVSGFLTGLSAFGDSKTNTSNVKAGLYTGAAMTGLALVGQIRYGRALAKVSDRILNKGLGSVLKQSIMN